MRERTRAEHREVELRRGNSTSYLGFSISQLTDAFGTQRGYIVIFQDLTRWRRLQEEVRMKDRMAAVGGTLEVEDTPAGPKWVLS